MRNIIFAGLFALSLAGMPMLAGCDRELSHQEKTTTDPNGNQTHSEQTTVQHQDGSVTTEKQSSQVNKNTNP